MRQITNIRGANRTRPARIVFAAAAMGVALGLAGCDPYNPGDRAVGGGLRCS